MSINPYQNVSFLDAFRRWWKPTDKVCSISHKTIEIPNRVFSTQDGRDYDIYNLAIQALKGKQGPNFPENFTEKDRKKFCQFFKPLREGFSSLWGRETAQLYELVFSKRLFPDCSVSEGCKEEARIAIFANSISRSQRSVLNQYFPEPIDLFKPIFYWD